MREAVVAGAVVLASALWLVSIGLSVRRETHRPRATERVLVAGALVVLICGLSLSAGGGGNRFLVLAAAALSTWVAVVVTSFALLAAAATRDFARVRDVLWTRARRERRALVVLIILIIDLGPVLLWRIA